jgi:hypothetical protein
MHQNNFVILFSAKKLNKMKFFNKTMYKKKTTIPLDIVKRKLSALHSVLREKK